MKEMPEEKEKRKEAEKSPRNQFVLFESKQVSAGVAGLDKLAARLSALSASGDDRATDLVRKIARKLAEIRATIDKFAPDVSKEMSGIGRKYALRRTPIPSTNGAPILVQSAKDGNPAKADTESTALVVAESVEELDESFLEDFKLPDEQKPEKKR